MMATLIGKDITKRNKVRVISVDSHTNVKSVWAAVRQFKGEFNPKNYSFK